MGRIAGWLGLLSLGALCGSWCDSGVSGTLIAGLLASLAAGALCEWLLPAQGSTWGSALVALLATFIPNWLVFLPALAFEAGVGLGATVSIIKVTPGAYDNHSSMETYCGKVVNLLRRRTSKSDRSKLVLTLLPAFAWLIPAVTDLLQFNGYRQRYALLVVFGSVLTYCAGLSCVRLSAVEEHVWQVEDMKRYQVRQLRTRISDLDEESTQANRVARLSERTRIARDIHDNVGHQLTRAIMQIQAGRVVAQSNGDSAAERSFAELGQTLDAAMTTIRRSVHDLEDDGTDFAAQMVDASQAIVVGSDGVVGQLQVELDNDIRTAPTPVTHCFVAIVRESLNNTVRHSTARSVQITLRDLPAFWQLVVQDDGGIQQSYSDNKSTGMSKPHLLSGLVSGERPWRGVDLRRGMGLSDIEIRAKALGGTAHSGPNRQGWRVFVSLPKEPWVDRIQTEHKEVIA